MGVALAIAVPVLFGILVAGRILSSPNAEELWKRALADMRARRWNDARTGLDQLERLRPPTSREWALRAEIAEHEGDSRAALEALHHVPEEHAIAPEALYMVGLIERRNNRLRHAEAAYRRALARDPRLIKAHKELIYILGMQFRRREVDAEFKALSRLTPLTHHDLFVWCLTHFIVWGPDSAVNLEAFIRADPDDRYSRLALATLLVAQPGQEAKVEQLLAPLPPDDPEAMALRVELKLNHGRTDEALAIVKSASPTRRPISPGSAVALHSCGATSKPPAVISRTPSAMNPMTASRSPNWERPSSSKAIGRPPRRIWPAPSSSTRFTGSSTGSASPITRTGIAT